MTIDKILEEARRAATDALTRYGTPLPHIDPNCGITGVQRIMDYLKDGGVLRFDEGAIFLDEGTYWALEELKPIYDGPSLPDALTALGI